MTINLKSEIANHVNEAAGREVIRVTENNEYPWKIIVREDIFRIRSNDGRTVIGMSTNHMDDKILTNDQLKRIVACVNACAGMSTDFIEAMGDFSDAEEKIVSLKSALETDQLLIEKLQRQNSELEQKLAESERRNKECSLVFLPLIEYGQNRGDLPVGSSIVDEAIKAWKQRDSLENRDRELVEDVKLFRESFIIAVGDKSPFAKQALKFIDEALEKAGV